MGITFVDILIQAVFLLLLILMVGYVDPLIQIKYEFHEAGKDLCNKINKDSPQSCIEFVKDKEIKVVKAGSKVSDPSKDFCEKRKLSPKECKSTLDQLAENVSVWPCIPPVSKNQLIRSTHFIVHGPSEIEFIKFSNEYIRYLNDHGFNDKLSKVNSLIFNKKRFYTPTELMSAFDFIKEEQCFHDSFVARPGKYSDSDLANELNSIRSLRSFSK